MGMSPGCFLTALKGQRHNQVALYFATDTPHTKGNQIDKKYMTMDAPAIPTAMVSAKRKRDDGDDSLDEATLPYRGKSATQVRKKRRTGGGRGRASRKISASPADAGQTRPSSSLVDDKHYRKNLYCSNGIRLRIKGCPLPDFVKEVVDLLELDKPSPTPTEEDLRQQCVITDHELSYFRPLETIIRPSFDDIIFPRAYNDHTLMRVDGLVMKRAVVPSRFRGKELQRLSEEEQQAAKFSIPVPDILYGYPLRAFPKPMQRLLPHILGRLEGANTAHTILPFLVVEFKGDGGSMWACTNQCLGGASACVHMGHCLTTALLNWDLPVYNNVVFSIALNGAVGSVYVAWKPIMEMGRQAGPVARFHVQNVANFAFGELDNFLVFQRCVRNIIDWGRGKRLEDVTNLITQMETKMNE